VSILSIIPVSAFRLRWCLFGTGAIAGALVLYRWQTIMQCGRASPALGQVDWRLSVRCHSSRCIL